MHRRSGTVAFLMNDMYTVKPGRLWRWQSLISREKSSAIGLERFVSSYAGIAELLISTVIQKSLHNVVCIP